MERKEEERGVLPAESGARSERAPSSTARAHLPLFLCPLSHRDPLTPSPPQFFFSRATRRAFPPRRALLFLLVTDDFSLPASARPRPPAAMAAGPKFLAGAAPFSPLPLDLFPSRFEPGSPPRSSFFHPSPPPTPNFSNFYSGFFSLSATTTTPIRLSGFSLSLSLHPFPPFRSAVQCSRKGETKTATTTTGPATAPADQLSFSRRRQICRGVF